MTATTAVPTPAFVDNVGNRWPLRITPPVARRIRDTLGLDLLAVTETPERNPFVRLSNDQYLLADVLWALVQPLAAERQIDREQFEEATWPQIDSVVETLLAAVVASFPEKKRAGLRKLIDAQNAALDRVMEKMTPEIDRLIDAAVDEAIENARQSTRTTSPPG
jgi:hypothetical protein